MERVLAHTHPVASVLCAISALFWAAPPALAGPLDRSALSKLESRLRAGDLGDVHGVVVLQGGKTVAEWYFPGEDEVRGTPAGVVRFGPDTLHDVRSVTKSVVGLLFGCALYDGAIKSLDEPVLDFFPEYPELRTHERMKIRLRDLLSMTSGLDWDERTFPYTDPRNSEIAMDAAADRYRYILSLPIKAEPGTRFDYSGGDAALVAAVITRATGEPVDVYARRRLFSRLGVTHLEWLKDGKGIPYAASGLRLRPDDMARIGQMMLQGGRWKGAQVIPADWIATATVRHAQIEPDEKCGHEYGYLWWTINVCADGKRTPVFFASGNGGQYIWVAPAEDLVVVSTTGMYGSARGERAATDILYSVLSAARPDSSLTSPAVP